MLATADAPWTFDPGPGPDPCNDECVISDGIDLLVDDVEHTGKT